MAPISPINPNPPPEPPPNPIQSAEHARRVAELILSDMVGGNHQARRWATRLDQCLAVLEQEAASLSAGVCEHQRWNGHGNAYCGKTGELI